MQCVIARSFAFIYARNQPNVGLLGITIEDADFFERAQQGSEIMVDLASATVSCGGGAFTFQLSEMEKQLIAAGGVTKAFAKFGKTLFQVMCGGRGTRKPVREPGGADRVKDIENL